MKYGLLLGLCLMTTAASADSWVRYAHNQDAIRYYDKLRLMNMSGTAFIWDMHDLKTPATDESGKSYRSVLHPTEFSCRKLQYRVLSTHKMSGAMGEGSMIAEHTMVGAWRDILSASPEEELMKAACDSQ